MLSKFIGCSVRKSHEKASLRLLGLRFFLSRTVTEIEHRDDGAFQKYLPGPKTGGFARGSFIAWRRSERVRDAAILSERIDDLYEFKNVVGEGGFGKVHTARHRRTGEVVAIKTLPKDRLKDQEALQLEVEFLKLSDHPNTVRYYEAFEDAQNIHLVMEMCSGGSLWEYINAAHDTYGPGVSEDELARITVQMLQGVAYCHSHSVAHRDIKPQNLLFSCGIPGKGSAIPIACSGLGDAPLKLVDFGIAGVVRSDRPEKRLLTKCAGTIGYMAPEVFGSKPYDGRSADVFSIGAVMHNLISGNALKWDSDKNAYTFPGRIRWKSLSANCQSLLEHLLHEDPALRATAGEALQHPWFKSMGVPASHHDLAGIFDRCFKRVHEFWHLSKLQKMIMYSMVCFAPLHNHHMEQLRISFLAADKGVSAGISCYEFVELGRQYSSFPSNDLRAMFIAADLSRTGKLSYCEWLAATAPSDWFCVAEHAERAFDTLDVKRAGFIRASDLCQLLPLVFDLTDIEAEILRFFPHGDGQLAFTDFCACSNSKFSCAPQSDGK